MGLPRGVTLIVGGGYHGKSTLLTAIERGVYDHIAGDGREWVVTDPSAVTVRAEDGRRICGVDIANFIGALPGGQPTERFVSDNASGSTSQAAAIIEALEVGSRCLLMDEDTCATNFMIRDARMQALVPSRQEPITPFIDRVAALRDQLDVSTVVVMGGSGDYFETADTVVGMDTYRPSDLTMAAKAVAAAQPTRRVPLERPWRPPAERRVLPASIDPGRGRRDVYIKTPAPQRLVLGEHEIDLAALAQVVERGQVIAMAQALAWLWRRGGDAQTPASLVQQVAQAVAAAGLGTLQPQTRGQLAAFRPFELAALLGRLRSLQLASEHG